MHSLVLFFFILKEEFVKIFIISGKSGSGKGEVAKIIKEYYNSISEKSVITEFSKYLKLYATEIINWNQYKEEKPRSFLQELGSNVRKIDPYFLINRMIEDIKIYELAKIDNIIIADARMPEELEKMKNNYDNVYIINIVNKFCESKLSIEQQKHITENALENYNKYDYVFENETLEELKKEIINYLKGIEK
ncbi:MAG: hypothetical protein E7172_03360 [Firmicutes bacterium]|nr:hypothetical protein [Bacillota bacterium]